MKIFNFKAFVAFLLVLQIALVGPVSTKQQISAASNTVTEKTIHQFATNTWAYSNLFNSPNGDLYLSHVKNNTEIAVKKWDLGNWKDITSITASATGDTSFSGVSDTAMDANGNLHAAFLFEKGTWLTSLRGVKYGVYKNGTWSFETVEAYSDPMGWKNMYETSVAVDTNGKAHIVYMYNDSNDPRKYEIHYATNQSGSWIIKTIVSGTGQIGIDEVKDPQIEVDKNNNIHITYVKEDNQNTYYGNYYYTHKNVNETEFSPAEKIVDAVTDQKYYSYTPFVVDSSGKIYFSYFEGRSYMANEPFTTYFQTNQSGNWLRESVYSDGVNATYPVRVSITNSKPILLMNKKTKDWPALEMGFFAMVKEGGTWTKGANEVFPSLNNNAPSELTYSVDSNENFMVVMEDNNLQKVSYFSGTSADFGLTTVPPKSSNAVLSNLALSSGTLSPGFAPQTTSYTASVGNAVQSIQLTPTVADSKATVKVNGAAVVSGTSASVPVKVGSNTIPVVVTAEDGTTVKSYTVTVTRAAPSSNASLSNLTISAGTLTPAFNPSIIQYNVSVPNLTDRIRFTPTVADSNATVTVGGNSVTSGQEAGPISLKIGENSVPIIVTAQDGTTTTYTVVVNRNSLPNTTDTTFAIDENATTGSTVGTLGASDPDGNSLTYSILSGNTNGIFNLNSTTGEIKVANGSLLDYETTTSYTLAIQVSDGIDKTTVNVKINVNDLNDNAPVPQGFTNTIDENTANGISVGTVTATDADAGSIFTYSITSGNAAGAFAIDSNTGKVTVADSSKLDYETVKSFILNVKVSDGTTTADTTVTIHLNNLNDNTPVAQDVEFTIDENTANGTKIGKVTASDADNDKLSYRIVSGTDAFKINSDTGKITVADRAKLDYETTKQFALTVRVSDGTYRTKTTVTINQNNLNDNRPVAEAANFTIDENTANKSVVGNVTAHDVDGDPLTYKIVGGNDAGAFKINSKSGRIRVADSSQLDYETLKTFTLPVKVSDGTHSAETTVTINLNNLNDNTPVAADVEFTIDEVSANGTAVGTVTASDADGDAVTYKISSGNEDGIFTLNETTGEITIVDASLLDAAAKATHILSVRASDGQNAATLTVTVNVLSSDATLSHLTSSKGDLSPEFKPGTTQYTMDVGDSVHSIKLTPTVADPNATVKINGELVASGQESDAITLGYGKNEITIEVTAQDGQTATYTIMVTRLQMVIMTVPVNNGGTATVSDDEVKLLDDNGTLVVELKKSLDEVKTIKFTAEQLEILINRHAMIKVVKDGVELLIPAVNFAKGEDLVISLERVDKNSEKLPSSNLAISAVYEFTIKQGNKIISHFEQDIQLAFPTNGYDHPEKLKVYYWNNDKKKWELVGGTFANGQIEARTNHFSTFAVFNPNDLADKEPSSESNLPNTGTNMYNWLFAGILVIIFGGAMFLVKRLRQKDGTI